MSMIVDFPGDAYAHRVRTTVRWLLSRKPQHVNKSFRTAQNRYVAQLVHDGVPPKEARHRAQEFARDVAAEFAAGRATRKRRPPCEVVNLPTRRRIGRRDITTAIGGAA